MFLSELIEALSEESTIMMCGLPASGKSTVAKLISQAKGHTILNTDMIRLRIYDKEEIFDSQKASDLRRRYMVYDVMFKTAKELIMKGERVILDGTFVRQELRVKAVEILGILLPNFYLIQTICGESTILKRIHNRQNKEYESNAITQEAYFNNLKIWEDVDILELRNKVSSTKFSLFQVISTDSDPLTWEVKGVIQKKDLAHAWE